VLKRGAQRTTAANPIEQARGCCLPIIDRMKKDSRLRHADGKYQGKLLFPWGFGAVMCNWQRSSSLNETARTLLEDCFPPHLTWYKEDIEAGGLDQEAFLTKLHTMLPFRLLNGLTDAQSDRVRAHLYPEYIADTQGELFKADPDSVETIKILDQAQECLARELGDGHRVIHGVAGSGKTIILQYRARWLAAENPGKPILVICYNIMRASLHKACLDNMANIEIRYFYDWCAHMKARYNISCDDNDTDKLAETICAAVLDGRIPGGQYHAVLIDEGHDFAEDWLRVLVKMAEGEDCREQQLLFLYDDTQSLYFPERRDLNFYFSLRSVGITSAGRTTLLQTYYCNSKEICRYADDFKHRFMYATSATGKDDFDIFTLDDEEDAADNGSFFINDGGLSTDIDFFILESGGKNIDDTYLVPTVTVESNHGSSIAPEYRQSTNRDEEIRTITDTIRAWHDEGTSYGDIAVLYYRKEQGRELSAVLKQAGIPLQNPISSDECKHYRPDPEKIALYPPQQQRWRIPARYHQRR